MSWTVTVNGNDYPIAVGTAPSVDQKLNGLDSFTVLIDNTNVSRADIGAGNVVVIKFQGNIMIDGYCDTPKWSQDAIRIQGQEQARELENTLIIIGGTHYVEYETTDASAILTAILGLAGYTLNAVNRPAPQNLSIRFFLKDILTGVEDIADTLGMDWYFIGTDLQMVADRGVNRGQLFNFNVTDKDDSFKQIENQIILYYTDKDGTRSFVTGDNLASQAAYGVMQGSAVSDVVYDAVTAQLLADAIATDRGVLPVYITMVQSIAEVMSRALGAGDDISLRDSQYDLAVADSWEIRLLSYRGGTVTIKSGTRLKDTTGQMLLNLEAQSQNEYNVINTEQIPKGSQQWNSDVAFSTGADPHDDLNWAAGTITYADTDTQAIAASAGVHTGLAVGTHYVYWTFGSNILLVVNAAAYATAVGPSKGIIARVTVPAEPTDRILIEAYNSSGSQVGEGAMDPTALATPAGWVVGSIVASAGLKDDGTVSSKFTVTIPAVVNATQYAFGYKINGTAEYTVITSDNNVVVVEGLRAGTVYNCRAAAISKLGVYSAWTATVNKTAAGDTDAPAQPTGLAATSKNKAILLEWNENAEADLDHYEVWMDDGGYALVAYVRTNYYTYMATSGQLDTAYNFKIKAVDHTGNASPFSAVDAGTAVYIEALDLAIEQRDWKSNISFIWDYPNKDWDEIWWGAAGDEKNLPNPVIEFSDGTSKTITRGTEGALADGQYVYYWTEGADTLTRDTIANYANAIGAGKGLVAIVIINEAEKHAPTLYTFNSYTPVIGTGIVAAFAIMTQHLTAEQIFGKDIGTQIDVGITNPGIRILGDLAQAVLNPDTWGDGIGGNVAPGIWGFAAGPDRTFWIDPATGNITIYGVGALKIKGQGIYWIDDTDALRGWAMGWAGANPYLQIGSAEDLWLTSGAGDDIKIIPGGGATDIYLYGTVLPEPALVSLGTPALPFKYFIPTTTLANRPAAASGIVGLVWQTREAGNHKTYTWQCVQTDDVAPTYEWIQTGIST